MQASVRNNHYILCVNPDEVNSIDKYSSLTAKLYDETSGRLDTEKKLHLGLGGNRKGIDFSLKYDSSGEHYIRITKSAKRRLLVGEAIMAKYSNGTITVQVENRS